MRKSKADKSDIRENQDYLNFIRKNHQAVQQLESSGSIEKYFHPLTKKESSSEQRNTAFTLETDRYGNMSPLPQDRSYGLTKKLSKKEILTLKGAVVGVVSVKNKNDFSPQNQLKSSTEYSTSPFSKQKNDIKSKIINIPSKVSEEQGQEGHISRRLFFPKLQHRLLSQKSESEILQKQILSVKQKKYREVKSKNSKNIILEKYAPISVNINKPIREEVETKHQKRVQSNPKHLKKQKTLKKQATYQQTFASNKLVKTYYDLKQQKDILGELIPTFKPLPYKKKEKIQILQLNVKYHKQLEQYLEANKVKKHQRKSSHPKLPKRESNLESYTEKKHDESQSDLLIKKESKTPSPTKKSSHSSIFKKKDLKNILFKESLNNDPTSIYAGKIRSYREFLFQVNFAHRIFDELILSNDTQKLKSDKKFKFYIGKGNNNLLVKSLMKRRFWWVQVDEPSKANFVWTQLKIPNYYQFQKKGYLQNPYDKLDDEYAILYKQKFKKKNKKKQLQKNESIPKNTGILRGQLPQKQKKIFTLADSYYFEGMNLDGTENPEKFKKFGNRRKYLPDNFLSRREDDPFDSHVHNHFVQNYYIGNKKALFYSLKRYYDALENDVFQIIPLTFHIKKGTSDPQYNRFIQTYQKIKKQYKKAQKSNTSTKNLSKNVWIVKPGELSNCGSGITVIDEIYELNTILKTKTKHSNGTNKTYIVQKYIQKPMLYKNRKFDIRHYMMISRMHGRLRAYWFSEGYIRTSSKQYDLEDVGDVMIHLTNDAVQKYDREYGKYEQGNKISYSEFQRYLDSAHSEKKYSFLESIYPRMKQIGTDVIKATCLDLDPHQGEHNFQIFGLDFMIDSGFNVWLIEVNTNPCLELSSNLLARLIPSFLQATFRLTIDPIFPPPTHYPNQLKYLAPDQPIERLQFELIFDEARDGEALHSLLRKLPSIQCGEIDEEDETFENEGKELELGDLE